MALRGVRMIGLLRAVLLALVVAAGALGGSAPPLMAQPSAGTQAEAPDYDEWTRIAKRAEDTVARGEASNEALESLRKELVNWRSRFQSAQSVNDKRIKTIQGQIDALGPAPAEGESEPDAISERRSELNDQLAEARAPHVRAEEAFTRANGLVEEIDKIIDTRKTDRIFRLGPSPLNPSNWPGAAAGLARLGNEVSGEIRENWNSSTGAVKRRENAPLIGVLSLLAFVLLVRGRRWFLRLVGAFIPRGSGIYHREFRWIIVSLSSFALPMLGLVALMFAVRLTGLTGARGDALLDVLPWMGLFLFGGRWMASVIFSSDDRAPEFCHLDERMLAKGRRAATGLGVMLAVAVLLGAALRQPVFPEEARLVLGFPVVVVMGLLLVRLGRVLRVDALDTMDDDDSGLFRDRLMYLVSRVVMGVGVVGPLLAVVGYFNAGTFFVFPSVMSLTLIGLIAVLQRLLVNGFALLMRSDPEGGHAESLIPVLVSGVLVLAAVPLFALIWGMRPSRLSEIWTMLRDGFTIGKVTISFSDIMTLVVVFVIGYTITRLIQGALRSSVLPRTKLDIGGREAIVTGTGYFGIVLAALLAITTAGFDLSSLAIVAGALSVGIGFGLQNIVSNFVSGIILLIERPIKKGDWIEVGGVHGYVGDISVRSTRIQTFDRSDVILPNADLVAGRVTNYTLSNLAGRVIVPVGVAYGSDTRKVEEILLSVAREHPMVVLNPEPYVVFKQFGADSLDFEIRAILRDVNFVLNVHSDMNHEIVKRFTEEGIEIPFAQRDIWLRNPETLRGAPAKGAESEPVATAKPGTEAPPAGQAGDSDAADGGDI
ncbi:DUF3772 domain-containing protein [Maritimibacter sp. 55A14]|uniref:DUF3772 domain-containing protein n=1 Tax=Maritimibacter sp. 55A14 TaxID=2174844 RepID=UPI000D6078A8|nr:DUF3772 domain-containing protein [Maritimibacter sp. 55A14]PWE34225.1 DUF3772 domain-containing protein [Maritimibacter sp. 55A14]